VCEVQGTDRIALASSIKFFSSFSPRCLRAAALGILVRKEYPWLLPGSLVVSFGVALAAIKSLLEVVKLANELQTAQLQMRKAALEIDELESKKEDRAALIVKPTAESEITKYDTNRLSDKIASEIILRFKLFIKWIGL
jgi:hypothetical protein